MHPTRAVIACLLSLPALLACPLRAADLLDVYQLARQQDARFQAQQAEYLATEELQPQALSALLPQVNLSGQYGREELDISRETEIGVLGDQSASFDTHGYSLRLDQVIYDHALFVQLRQTRPVIAQARAELDAASQVLILRVSTAYFEVLAARDNLEFARAEKEAIVRQLEQARKQFEVGMIAITDVKEAQAAYDLAIAQEVAAENRLATTREALQVITGELPQELSDLGERVPLVLPEPADIDAWVATALEQNLQLMAARLATETASLEVDRRYAQHYPTLDLFATKTNEDTGGGIFGAQETDDEIVGIQLNVPIFSGGFVTSNTREAQFLLEQTRELQELQRRRTIRQTRASYMNVVAGISQVKALWQALESNRAAADAARAGFEVGTRTSLDVLLALREQFRTQRDLARARYNYLLDTLRLKQAAGTLTAEDLVALNAWLS